MAWSQATHVDRLALAEKIRKLFAHRLSIAGLNIRKYPRSNTNILFLKPSQRGTFLGCIVVDFDLKFLTLFRSSGKVDMQSGSHDRVLFTDVKLRTPH